MPYAKVRRILSCGNSSVAEYCFAKAKVEGSTPFFRFTNKKYMSNLIFNDKKKRTLYLKNELKRLEYKSIFSDLSLSKDTRYKAMMSLTKMPRNSSRVRIKNRCILTGRNHSVLRMFKLSRIKFRELASQGLLMGVSKSSW